MTQLYTPAERRANNQNSETITKKDFSKNPLEIQRFDFSIKIQMEGRVI